MKARYESKLIRTSPTASAKREREREREGLYTRIHDACTDEEVTNCFLDLHVHGNGRERKREREKERETPYVHACTYTVLKCTYTM